MMKKKNLKIADLKIQSFVTTVEDHTVKTVKGGFGTHFRELCETVDAINNQPVICRNTIYPDESYCNPACLTQQAIVC
ncbi:MAG: pinensin family lanthipeptide [Cyclobacteriaceae bacterium]